MSKWIQGAIKHPGALHRDLGVPQGQKIPRAKLEAAAHGDGKTAQRARLAITLGGLSHSAADHASRSGNRKQHGHDE